MSTLIYGNRTKPENFGNFIALYNSTRYSDIMLKIYDNLTLQYLNCAIYTHKLILDSGSRHFNQLFSETYNDRRRAEPSNSEDHATTEEQPKEEIQLFMDFSSGLTLPLLKDFFKLFYVVAFDETHLSAAEREFIANNVLFLYQLASYFQFLTLCHYCEQILCENMDLQYFRVLLEFSLIQCTEKNCYAIKDESLRIFTRLIQWYQCCIGEHISLPLDSSGQRLNCPQKDTEKVAFTDQSDVARKSRGYYFSHSKEQILLDCISSIENFHLCPVPQKSLTTSGTPYAPSTAIAYYAKLCTNCYRNDDDGHILPHERSRLIDLGFIARVYANGTEKCAFRLRKDLDSSENALEIHMERRYNEKPRDQVMSDETEERPSVEFQDRLEEEGHGSQSLDMDVEEVNCGDARTENDSISLAPDDGVNFLYPTEGDQLYRCETRLSMLSKMVENETSIYEVEQMRQSTITEVSRFQLHEEQYCYEGKCGKCKKYGPLFILLIDLKLEPHKMHFAMAERST